jgi:hypothetical protein
VIGRNVTLIGDMRFRFFQILENVAFEPDSICRGIGEISFGGCVRLLNVNLPASLTSIENYAFSRCTRLKSVVIPVGVTHISLLWHVQLGQVARGRRVSRRCCFDWLGGAFILCKSLRHIELPGSLRHIHEYTFTLCTALTNVTLGGGV